jgi:ABC-2 family transporter protein
MTWLTWRQHRLQLLFGALALGMAALILVPSGHNISSAFHHAGLAACLSVPGRDCADLANQFTEHYSALSFTIPLFLAAPALVGLFWGAPLVAREVEQGTNRLAWTQGVSRVRWFDTKIIVFATATVAGTALLSWLLSWWSLPFVTVSDDRFAYGVFDLRGIVPIAYALFALALGVTVGILLRRVVPAMAVTLGAYTAVRVIVEIWLRPHYARPLTETYGFFFKEAPRQGHGDWILSTRTLDGAGHVLAKGEQLDFNLLNARCPELHLGGRTTLLSPQSLQPCLQKIGLHIQSTYQPGSRYWAFQGIESAIFVVLAAGLIAFSVFWLKRRMA